MEPLRQRQVFPLQRHDGVTRNVPGRSRIGSRALFAVAPAQQQHADDHPQKSRAHANDDTVALDGWRHDSNRAWLRPSRQPRVGVLRLEAHDDMIDCCLEECVAFEHHENDSIDVSREREHDVLDVRGTDGSFG